MRLHALVRAAVQQSQTQVHPLEIRMVRCQEHPRELQELHCTAVERVERVRHLVVLMRNRPRRTTASPARVTVSDVHQGQRGKQSTLCLETRPRLKIRLVPCTAPRRARFTAREQVCV